MHRIAVIGTTGSGKTTLAHLISDSLGIPHVEVAARREDIPPGHGAGGTVER